MKCLVISKSIDNPATRYRVAPVVERLRDRGDDVTLICEPGLGAQVLLLSKIASFDLVFIQRKLLNSMFVSFLAKFGTPIVFDHDDAIFLKSSGLPSSTRSARYKAIVRASSLVLAGNKHLCNAAAAQGAQVALVPTSVLVDHYGACSKSDELRLVWIGSNSTARYLEQHRKMLEKVGKQIPEIKLRVIADFHFSVVGLDVECIRWSEEVEFEMLGSAHIGIAPMVDDRWTRGKCALKIIQYMAAGLPVVSSNVGANKEVVTHGETGFLVDTIDDWCAAIYKLHASDKLRAEMGAAGRRKVEESYNQELNTLKVVGLLESVASGEISRA